MTFSGRAYTPGILTLGLLSFIIFEIEKIKAKITYTNNILVINF